MFPRIFSPLEHVLSSSMPIVAEAKRSNLVCVSSGKVFSGIT